MQIVIEIPESVYEHLKQTTEDSHDEDIAIDAIIHGVMIFEGDIIKQYEKTQFGDPVSDFGLIKWDNKECMLFRTSTRIGKDRLVTSRDIYEVVGNIYDNPELLEVSKE